MFPDVKWIGAVLVMLGAIVFVFDIHVEHGHLAVGQLGGGSTKKRFEGIWVRALLVFVSLTALGFGLGAYYSYREKPSPALPPITGIAIDPDTPVLSAYHKDFGEYLRLSTEIDFHDTGSDRRVIGNQQLLIRFESNTQFMMFYIPHTEMVYSVAINIADNIDKLLRHMKSLLITRQDSGDFNKFELKKPEIHRDSVCLH